MRWVAFPCGLNSVHHDNWCWVSQVSLRQRWVPGPEWQVPVCSVINLGTCKFTWAGPSNAGTILAMWLTGDPYQRENPGHTTLLATEADHIPSAYKWPELGSVEPFTPKSLKPSSQQGKETKLRRYACTPQLVEVAKHSSLCSYY